VYFANTRDGWLYGPHHIPVAVTHDGGLHWTNAGLAATLSLAAVGQSVWAVAGCIDDPPCQPVLVVSGDAGKTWTKSSVLVRGPHAQLVRLDARTAWIISSGFLLPPGQTSGASLPPVLIGTQDGGTTWQSLASPCSSTGMTGTHLAALPGGSLWAACAGQPGAGQQPKELQISLDRGAHWGLPLPLSWVGYLNDLTVTSPQSGWVAFGRGTLYGTRDAGRTWKPVIENDVNASTAGSGVIRVQFVDPQNGWAATNRTLYRTSDGGAQWTAVVTLL
jgi:photosystem II stability/assembly factor-like uncharacterized protein